MSGPKRYDYVASASATAPPAHDDDDEKGRGNKKEESGKGKVEQGCSWIYLRDGSSLTELLREELGVEVEVGYGEEDRYGTGWMSG